MGPYGSVGAHIKTGRSPMAQDHFKTPPDPKMAHKNPKITQKSWLVSCWDNYVFSGPDLEIWVLFLDFLSLLGRFKDGYGSHVEKREGIMIFFQ